MPDAANTPISAGQWGLRPINQPKPPPALQPQHTVFILKKVFHCRIRTHAHSTNDRTVYSMSVSGACMCKLSY